MPAEEFHLDAKALAKNVPFPLRGLAEDFFNKVNALDMDHNGKADIAQAAKLFFILMPLGQKLNGAVDFNLFADWICEQSFVKDQALVKAAIKEAFEQVEKMDDKEPG